jgi:uncharacterized membrane protein YGL010W
MRTIHRLLEEYGESHQNETNKMIHWICVPAIFFSIVGLLYSLKLPFFIYGVQLSIAMIIIIFLLFYYLKLSPKLTIGMLVFCFLCLGLCYLIEMSNTLPLWLFSIIVFVLAWIGQFYGHKIEGKKPSFLKDIQFLMIGPAWLMQFVYNKMGIKV